MKLIEQPPRVLLEEFLIDYCTLFNLNIDEVRTLIKHNLEYFNSDKVQTVSKEMERNWYKKLSDGIADYSVYDNGLYFVDLWCCWKLYSRNYLRIIDASGTMVKYWMNHSVAKVLTESTTSVLDLGCGIGYTTAALKELFPNSTVYGYNIKDSKQYKFCEFISEKYGFKMTGDYKEIGTIDLVFASEYFEHIERPLEHLNDLIRSVKPKHFIIANSFNTKSIGHFIKYKDKDEIIDQQDISRRFNKVLKRWGYEKIRTKIFNNKPAVYSFNES